MLKAVLLRSQLRLLRKELSDAQNREAELNGEIADIEVALSEAETQEDLNRVSAEADEACKNLDTVKETIKGLDTKIKGLEAELYEIEKDVKKEETERGKNNMSMNKRGIIGSLPFEERSAIFADEQVRTFIKEARQMMSEKRSLTGGELHVPDILLGILRPVISEYSKLYPHLNVKKIGGTSRQTVAGTVSDAIWTDSVGKISEIDINFIQVSLDAHKISAFVPVPNSIIEDTDEDFLETILQSLGSSLGRGVDKAGTYGSGVGQPLGIVTRLAQNVKPSDWNEKQGEWTDLSSSHITKFDGTSMSGAKFFEAFAKAFSVADPEYTTGKAFVAMNRKTRLEIQAKALAFNSAAELVSKVDGTLPFVGGTIVELSFMKDGDIVGGYGEMYPLAERSGIVFSDSSHVKFIDDQTVYAARARYDGKPVRGEAFFAVNIHGNDFTTSLG